jgi:hypothetical protein
VKREIEGMVVGHAMVKGESTTSNASTTVTPKEGSFGTPLGPFVPSALGSTAGDTGATFSAALHPLRVMNDILC